jgi:hypothetical protein
MTKTLKFVGASLLICSATANVSAHQCDMSSVDKESANQFVQGYYQRLSKGVNREQLRIFLSSEQNELVDSTILTLARDLGHEVPMEVQRLMDSYGVQAACESLTLKEGKVWGDWGKYSSLSYDITPKCTDWTNNKVRSIELRFSKSLCEWVITDVKNEVAYK